MHIQNNGSDKDDTHSLSETKFETQAPKNEFEELKKLNIASLWGVFRGLRKKTNNNQKNAITPPDIKTQEDQLEELKKINASLPDVKMHEDQLGELKRLNQHSLQYNKIIAGAAVVTMIISLVLAIKN